MDTFERKCTKCGHSFGEHFARGDRCPTGNGSFIVAVSDVLAAQCNNAHLIETPYELRLRHAAIKAQQDIDNDAAHIQLHAEALRSVSTKPTNPKDACGVRKASLSVVPASVLAELGVALQEGALKYGRSNYREVGVRASVYYDATIRHLFTWWEGEDIDTDSNLSHITKAIASLAVLRDAMMRNMVEDDRPPKTLNMYAELNKRAAELQDKYADRAPKHVTELNVNKEPK